MKHVDFLYVCYAYYGNNSFVPIRTRVSITSTELKEASFFMNDNHFILHQIGKMKEFNQNDNRQDYRILYRTI